MSNKFFRSALESVSLNNTIDTDFHGNLSLEEEAIIFDDAINDYNEIGSDIAEVERISQVSDGLDDLATIADSIDTATPQEVALIQTVGQMAVAGTNVDPSEVVPTVTSADLVNTDGTSVPSLESFIGNKISVAGIREVAAKIWEKIKAFVAYIWEKITRFIHDIWVGIPRIKNTIEVLKVKVAEMNKNKLAVDANNRISFIRNVPGLMVAGKLVNSGSSLITELGKLQAVSKVVFEEYVNALVNRGHAIAGVMYSNEENGLEKTGKKLFGSIQKTPFPKFQGKKQSGNLLGNFYIEHSNYSDGSEVNGETDDIILALEVARSFNISVSDNEIIPVTKEQKSMPVLTLDEISKVLANLDSLITTVEQFESKGYSKLLANAVNITNSFNKFSRDVQAKGDDEPRNKAIYKGIVDFGTTYSKWAYSPTSPTIINVVRVIRSTMVAINKSIALYPVVVV